MIVCRLCNLGVGRTYFTKLNMSIKVNATLNVVC